MELLGLKETLDKLTKGDGVRWYRHALTRNIDEELRALDFEVVGRRGCGVIEDGHREGRWLNR